MPLFILLILTFTPIYFQGKRTALMEAAREGKIDVVALLLNHGADEDLQDTVRILTLAPSSNATYLMQYH